MNTITAIANTLRSIGNQKCLQQAEILDKQSATTSSLHLRSLGLNASNIEAIASCLKFNRVGVEHPIKSISFSYNELMGDEGVIALIQHLPLSVLELGLVGCNISDLGGTTILDWMKNSPNLKMICMEQNNFTKAIRVKFDIFSDSRPEVFVVY